MSKCLAVALKTRSATVVLSLNPLAISEISCPNPLSTSNSCTAFSTPSISFPSALTLALFSLPSMAAKLISIALIGLARAKASNAFPCPLMAAPLAWVMAPSASSGTMSSSPSRTRRCFEVAKATTSDMLSEVPFTLALSVTLALSLIIAMYSS